MYAERPKSPSLTSQSNSSLAAVRKMLSGLTSRWMTGGIDGQVEAYIRWRLTDETSGEHTRVAHAGQQLHCVRVLRFS